MNKNLKLAIGTGAISLLVISGTAFAAPGTITDLKAKATTTPKATQTPKVDAATPTPSAASDAGNTSEVEKKTVKRLIQGHVKSIESNTILLNLPRNKPNLSLTTDSKTTFYIGSATGSIKDIKSNDDVVAIIESAKKAKNLKSAPAMAVAVLSKDDQSVSVDADPSVFVIRGNVRDVSASGFSILDRRSKQIYSVIIDSQTKIIEPGVETGTLTGLKKNDITTVYGTLKNNNLAATIVLEKPDSRSARYSGVMIGINGSKLLVFTTDNEALTVDASNVIIVQRGNPAATLSALKDGHPLSMFGIKNSDGTITAQIVDEFGALGRPYTRSVKAALSESPSSDSSTKASPTSAPTPTK